MERASSRMGKSCWKLILLGLMVPINRSPRSTIREGTTMTEASRELAQNQGQPAPTNPDGSPKSPNGRVARPFDHSDANKVGAPLFAFCAKGGRDAACSRSE